MCHDKLGDPKKGVVLPTVGTHAPRVEVLTACGGLMTLHTGSRLIRWDGVPVSGPRPQEIEVLLILMKNAGEVVTRDDIMRGLYPERPFDDLPEPKLIDVRICGLRKPLRRRTGREDGHIETIHVKGYRIAK